MSHVPLSSVLISEEIKLEPLIHVNTLQYDDRVKAYVLSGALKRRRISESSSATIFAALATLYVKHVPWGTKICVN